MFTRRFIPRIVAIGDGSIDQRSFAQITTSRRGPVPETDLVATRNDGLAKLSEAIERGEPYAVAFIDVADIGDGRSVVHSLSRIDENLQIVLCTPSRTPETTEASEEFESVAHVAILSRPLDATVVRQLALALMDKWLARQQRNDLEQLIARRTEELKRAALHDMLTGLPNRLLFNDRLDTAIRRARRDPYYRVAVLFVDCDRFKIINDSLGHRIGDMLLLQIAERLKGAVREVDTVTRPVDEPVAARLGGDEFAILLENLKADADAARVASRLLDALSKPYSLDEREVHSTVSIGMTTSFLGYSSAEDMIRDADTAMHRAKSMGGSSFVLFDEKMHHEAVVRLTIENDLHRAIERGQLSVHYQPIMVMRTRELTGFEALARWEHPTLGWIPPETFIPLAEQTGSILSIGIWVLENACRQLAQWQSSNASLSHLTMSVNVSRRQLVSEDLVAQVRRILRETCVNPRNLKLEITESAVMDDPDAAVLVLREIQQLGVQLHMDDFGSGFSSLSCLQNFPLDGLKIDREFVDAVPSRPNHAAIVRSVVSLAHNLRVPLVAEGIETPEQIAALEAMGCDHAQGYLFARPMDPQAATAFIAQHLSKSNAA